MIRKMALCLLTVVAIFTVATTSSHASNLLTQHVREVTLTGEAPGIGHLPASQVMQLDIILALRDQFGLDAFLKDLSNPYSSSYRQFLTPAEFTERFGPSQADYDTVVRFAKASGFEIVGGSRDGMIVQVKGTVAVVEAAFHVSLNTYIHPTEERIFFAPDREPTTDLPFALWHVSGLDNFSIPHTRLVKRSDYAREHGIDADKVVTHATTGSGPSASFLGSDMRAAYYGGLGHALSCAGVGNQGRHRTGISKLHAAFQRDHGDAGQALEFQADLGVGPHRRGRGHRDRRIDAAGTVGREPQFRHFADADPVEQHAGTDQKPGNVERSKPGHDRSHAGRARRCFEASRRSRTRRRWLPARRRRRRRRERGFPSIQLALGCSIWERLPWK